MNEPDPLMLPRAILFDMDGTLTAPLLDFDRIRSDMGIGDGPILESMAKMSEADLAVAQRILFEHENRAACESTLNAGCVELLDWVRDAGIVTALVTRNTRRSVRTIFDRHALHFEVCITREDGKYKPDPAPLYLACERLNVSPADAWMVGDGYHDIEAGLAARIRTVWISHGSIRPFAAEPNLMVKNLSELLELLKSLLKALSEPRNKFEG